MSTFKLTLPDNLVTAKQLKMILTSEIRGIHCKTMCKNSCMNCDHVQVVEERDGQEVVPEIPEEDLPEINYWDTSINSGIEPEIIDVETENISSEE